MKLLLTSLLMTALLSLSAADKKQLAGPKGGRLLEKTEPLAEFFVEKDRTATVAFYDTARKELVPAGQQVTLIAETKEGKVKIAFEKKGELLVSKSKLPDGDGYNLVVQFRAKPEARVQNFRFKLELHTCNACRQVEYACNCHE
jgi:hypothetical protein